MEEKNNKLNKKIRVLIFFNILLLIINFIFNRYNLNDLNNSTDKLKNIVGVGVELLWPHVGICIIIQFVILILTLFNKKQKQFFNIVLLVFQIMFLIYANIFAVPFMGINFLIINIMILGQIDILIFELLNIYICICMIKKVSINKRKCGDSMNQKFQQ